MKVLRSVNFSYRRETLTTSPENGDREKSIKFIVRSPSSLAEPIRHYERLTIVHAKNPDTTTKFVLMNTAGNSNRDLHEPISFGEKCVIGLVRLLLPPPADNEQAADYLRTGIGQNDKTIQWAVVRPDTLINADQVTGYEVHPSPTRSAIFNPGSTSRINVAHFMADLITSNDVWSRWQGKMPVIYNKAVF